MCYDGLAYVLNICLFKMCLSSSVICIFSSILVSLFISHQTLFVPLSWLLKIFLVYRGLNLWFVKYNKKYSLCLLTLSASTSFLIFVIVTSLFPADRGAIISQFRVWPFPSITIIAFGERNRNPGHHFAGVNIIWSFYINNTQACTWHILIMTNNNPYQLF